MTDTAQDLRSALEPATRDDAIKFLENAARNWPHLPRLNNDDLDDVATALTRHAQKAVAARAAPATDEPVAVIGDDWKLLWASQDTLTAIINRTGLNIGDRLYRHPPAAEPVTELGWNPTHEVGGEVHPHDAERVGLREALEKIAALRSPNNGDYVSIAQRALATPARTDDAAQAGGDVAAMREAAAALVERLAADKYQADLAADIRALPLPSQEVEPAAEDQDFRAYVVKAGERLAPHSADPSGTPTRDALVWINAALHPQARKSVPLDYAIAPNVPATQAAYPTGAGEGRDPLRDIVFRYIDRMNDVAPECGDPADRILGEFARDVNKVLKNEFQHKVAGQ